MASPHPMEKAEGGCGLSTSGEQMLLAGRGGSGICDNIGQEDDLTVDVDGEEQQQQSRVLTSLVLFSARGY
ncbi:hypothetical protein ASPCAL10983 [Aspergillus calidoustus]|uniref:Uncharacterized protein n=1 Tax=Aspergillus calidoustus TaxID=454130 RepID=A0A0U4ZDK3_ASPCI|nr:hypothetical protein ASPCAL10983 [Aspergillus calidoustus]